MAKILELVRPKCAGIDMGSLTAYVGYPDQTVKSYSTFTASFKQLIAEPTRITTTTSILIDHFITNSLTDYATVENVQIADHKLIRLPF